MDRLWKFLDTDRPALIASTVLIASLGAGALYYYSRRRGSESESDEVDRNADVEPSDSSAESDVNGPSDENSTPDVNDLGIDRAGMLGMCMLLITLCIACVHCVLSGNRLSDLPLLAPMSCTALGMLLGSQADCIGDAATKSCEGVNSNNGVPTATPYQHSIRTPPNGTHRLQRPTPPAPDQAPVAEAGSQPPLVPPVAASHASLEAATTSDAHMALGDEATATLKKADTLHSGQQYTELRSYLEDALIPSPESCLEPLFEIELQWRLARALRDLSTQAAEEEKEALVRSGLAKAERALELDENSAAAHKWMGIMYGALATHLKTSDKIQVGYKLKKHIERSISIDPSDPTCHNVLGQFCMAIAKMSWIEKRAAAAIYGALPETSLDEALQHFLNAERLQPGFWKENVWLIAEMYKAMNQPRLQREYLEKALNVPVQNEDDKRVHGLVEKALRK